MSHRSWALALTFLVACGSKPEPSTRPEPPSLEGTFVGDLSIDRPDQNRTIFTTAKLEVAGNGIIHAGAVTTQPPTQPVDEVGTATGRIELRSDKRIEVELELTFPTLGVYTAVGDGTYVDQQLSASLRTRTKDGAVVGNTALFIHREK